MAWATRVSTRLGACMRHQSGCRAGSTAVAIMFDATACWSCWIAGKRAGKPPSTAMERSPEVAANL